ncbi:MAG: hypothetical protein QOJ19_1915 [Acidimicrobiia bacterium]|nr:hypothetical protein [Acidimicrobiia bacterium]
MKKLKWLVAAGVAGAVLASGSVAFAATTSGSTPASSSSTSESACLPAGHDDAWPDYVQGRPAGLDSGDLGGTYLWHDVTGWHLRVTHATDDRTVFTGTIRTGGALVDVQAVRLEAGDAVVVGPDRHTLTFRFANYGHIDGVDFRTSCAAGLTFDFERGGTVLPTTRIFVGRAGVHAESDPFRVVRTG